MVYHRLELEIARDRTHKNHLMPTFEPRHKQILDVGCGMGQTLLAANLAEDVKACGVDTDASAIAGGQALATSNIQLSVGSGEHLDFPDAMFDLVICRVALPYMNVSVALKEMSRVLRSGGDIWLALHPLSMLASRAGRSMKQGRVKDVIYCGFIALNSVTLHAFGKQLVLNGKTESCQTQAGIVRVLKSAGFDCNVHRGVVHFVAQGSKTG